MSLEAKAAAELARFHSTDAIEDEIRAFEERVAQPGTAGDVRDSLSGIASEGGFKSRTFHAVGASTMRIFRRQPI
jgi:hypothetical protein